MTATRSAPRDSPAGTPGASARAWLDRLFAGTLPFAAIEPTTLSPGPRSAAEYDAVARAAGCPDLFVIHADAPAGERAIVDLARAVAGRVLVLTPDPAAADRIAEKLLRLDARALRALADDENPVRPSPAVSRVTSAALGQARFEQARRDAAAAVEAAGQRLAAFANVAKATARLAEVTDRMKSLDATVAEQSARLDRVEADTRDESGTPFATTLAKLRTDRADASTRLASELQTLTASLSERESALAQARKQHAELTRKPGLLARLFGGKPQPTIASAEELASRVLTLGVDVSSLTDRVTTLRAKLADAEAGFAAQQDTLVATEVASRRAVIEEALSGARSERERAQTEAEALKRVIAAAAPGEDHAAAERQLAEARRHAEEVADMRPALVAAALGESRIVVGTPGSLDVDPVFAPPAEDPPFAMLVLDRAEELPEAEFVRLSQLAERWVLVGNAIPHGDPQQTPPRSLNGRSPSRNGRATEAPFVTRVARLLDRETWAAEGPHFVSRLVHLAPGQRRGVTREPLADRPEIELRFAASDDGPVLAEIAFPAGTAATDAKGFLFHTLGEVLLRPCGDVQWSREPHSLTATWPAVTGADGSWIDLEPGVRERVVGTGLFAFTAAVSFDPAAGWDAEKAQAWLAHHLPPPPTSRLAVLPRSPGPRPPA